MMTRRHGLHFAAAMLSLSLAGPEALAQTPAGAGSVQRLVKVLDGSLYYGELVEEVPSDHVTLKLATGEVRRFGWNELLEAPAPPPASASPPPMAAAPPALLAPTLNTFVRLATDDPEAGLYRRSGVSMISGGRFNAEVELWNKVCSAPCAEPVDSLGTYSIRGRNIMPSPSFGLRGQGLATVDVRAGHVGANIGGRLLILLGGIGVGVSLPWIFLAGTNGLGSSPSEVSTMRIGAGIGLGAGIALLASGIAVWAGSHTKVHIDDQAVARLAVPGRGPLYVSAEGLRF